MLLLAEFVNASGTKLHKPLGGARSNAMDLAQRRYLLLWRSGDVALGWGWLVLLLVLLLFPVLLLRLLLLLLLLLMRVRSGCQLSDF